MPEKPHRAATAIAGSLLGIGAFQGFLHLWDFAATGDTLMSLYERLPAVVQFLDHPASSTVMLGIGLVSLWWFTKDDPKPVVLYGANYHAPLPTKKHPVFKTSLISVGCALMAAIGYISYHNVRARSVAAPIQVANSNSPVSTPVPSARQTSPVKSSTPESQKRSVPKNPVTLDATAPALPDPSKRVIPQLTIPDRPIATTLSASGNPARTVVAKIGNKVISANGKAPGELYVTVHMLQGSIYRGTIDQGKVDAVVASLEKAGKVLVFVGGYMLTVSGKEYGAGAGFAPASSRGVYYFDPALESTCKSVQAVVAEVIGEIPCIKARSPEPTKDPNEYSVQSDFWIASGLDMEIWL